MQQKFNLAKTFIKPKKYKIHIKFCGKKDPVSVTVKVNFSCRKNGDIE